MASPNSRLLLAIPLLAFSGCQKKTPAAGSTPEASAAPAAQLTPLDKIDYPPVPQPEKLGRWDIPNPDFTQGDPLPEVVEKDILLGVTGARGWIYNYRVHTGLARQIFVTRVAADSPAAGILREGDILLGVNRTPFHDDAREEFAKALTAAEASDGNLKVLRWRDQEIDEATIQLPVLGAYSATAPYDCPKSKRILEQAAAALAERMKQPGYAQQNAIPRALNALGLLATGKPEYHPMLKREAEWAADYSQKGFATWYYGYLSVFLAEYVLATGDESVLPGLRRMMLEAAEGQSAVGTWGHKFAYPNGRLPGYGMMNSPGAVLSLGMALAREAGVSDTEVATAIERSRTFLEFYIGKGSIPYGDHGPYMSGHEDNGKNGMVTVLFDQLGNEKGARFFNRMSTAAHSSDRDLGHTGNFFNITWAMPGVSRGGPMATGAWMREYGAWYFDLNRSLNWSFEHQGPPSNKPDSYANWDATGVYLIAYAMPRKAIRLTGSRPSILAPLDHEAAGQLIEDGRGMRGNEPFTAYDDLPPGHLVKLLTRWSPIVRQRAANAIEKREDFPLAPVIDLLDDPSPDARLGACEALAACGNRAAIATPQLLTLLDAEDMWLRIKAVEALAGMGSAAMEAVPTLLKRMARGPSPDDPRAMEQRYIVDALFHPREGMLRGDLAAIDQNLLLEAARSALANEDGHTRARLAPVLKNLSLEQLRPILPAIHQAIAERSPSGVMFDGGIQHAGLDLFSRHHISQGIGLAAEHTWKRKKHGSESALPKTLEFLKRYGAHAQRAIPVLERAAEYFEHEEEDFPKSLSLKKAEMVRQAIREIRASKERPELIELEL